jgi:hypothetical protein
MASKHPKTSKQGTADKRKYVTLTIPQKLEIIRRPETGKSQRELMASYNTGSSTIIHRTGRTNYDRLQLPVKVCRTFPSGSH